MIDVGTYNIFTMDDVKDGFVMTAGDILENNGRRYRVEDAVFEATIGVPVEIHYTLREIKPYLFEDAINPTFKIVQTNPKRLVLYSDNTVVSKTYHGLDAKIDIEPEEDNKEEWINMLEK